MRNDQPTLLDLIAQQTPQETQAEGLHRVSTKITPSIMRFWVHIGRQRDFHASELHDWVAADTGLIAPASADRILRDLRQKGALDYVVVNRRQSLYRFV